MYNNNLNVQRENNSSEFRPEKNNVYVNLK